MMNLVLHWTYRRNQQCPCRHSYEMEKKMYTCCGRKCYWVWLGQRYSTLRLGEALAGNGGGYPDAAKHPSPKKTRNDKAESYVKDERAWMSDVESTLILGKTLSAYCKERRQQAYNDTIALVHNHFAAWWRKRQIGIFTVVYSLHRVQNRVIVSKLLVLAMHKF